MDQHTPTFAGIDVSKATLDAYLHPEGSHRQFKNHKTGWRALRGWLNAAHPDGVVYEATGAYQPVDEVCPGRRSHRLILWGPGLKGICRWQWDSRRIVRGT